MTNSSILYISHTVMAERQTEFVYHNIELYKSQNLGSGSYGGVCKARCDGLLCAAKIMHPTLFDLHNTGAVSYLSKFQEECQLLSLPRHPNIVQFLATYCDPTHNCLFSLELCNESLTAFLERAPRPLSYHTELNICHDIALALVSLCPGNVLYMSPEALDEAKTYTAKLDVFSFDVIAIQILTRQFPNPTDRFRLVYSLMKKFGE